MANTTSLLKPGEKEVYSTSLRIYSWTANTFIKREGPPSRRQKNIFGEGSLACASEKNAGCPKEISMLVMENASNAKRKHGPMPRSISRM